MQKSVCVRGLITLLLSVNLLLTGCSPHHANASTAATAPTLATSAPQTEALQQAPAQHVIAPIVSLAPAAPVLVVNRIRESVPADYLRVGFFPSQPTVTTLARPGAVRAFLTATAQYEPPLTLQQQPLYSGLEDQPAQYLVAMRCHVPNPAAVDAILATWPNVFAAILRDHPVTPADCAAPTDPAVQVSCFAAGYKDTPGDNVPVALAQTLDYAATLQQPANAALATWLQRNYGIYPAFSGLGYSAKDSYNLGPKAPMDAQQILTGSISSEYLLKNVTLAAAGCRCITVAPYTGRSVDPLDPNFIDQAGGDGSCTTVPKLQKAQ